ncbi:MAG: branched-chain amino acid ABC transporter permease [Neomegalonema sp.]|nr:branched-chain amino acid ABC transporter permease [Neomegalonema sp.]
MNELIFFVKNGLIFGLSTGAVYALGAVGVTLIFSILRFAHFAHGELMTLGAFFAYILVSLAPDVGPAVGLPTAIIMLPAAMALTALSAGLLDAAVYKPLRDANSKPVVFVMASIGVLLMLQGLIRLVAGASARSMYVDDRKEIFRIAFPPEWTTAKLVVTESQLMMVGTAAIFVLALHLFLTHAKLGKAMRAMSDEPDLARISGVDTRTVVAATWAIGGGLAAAAGVLLSLDVSLKPDLSFHIILPIFAAAIVGGVGSPYGAIAGGLLVGFVETFAVFNWAIVLRPLLDGWVELPRSLAFAPTQYKITVPFLILIVVLVVRPTGLFRGKVI